MPRRYKACRFPPLLDGSRLTSPLRRVPTAEMNNFDHPLRTMYASDSEDDRITFTSLARMGP